MRGVERALSVLYGVLIACHCSAEGECPSCGACDSAIDLLLLDSSTGEAIGHTTAAPEAQIIGETGWCNSYGECRVDAKNGSVETVYTFTVVVGDVEIAAISETPAPEAPGAECCRCGYASRHIEVIVDRAQLCSELQDAADSGCAVGTDSG